MQSIRHAFRKVFITPFLPRMYNELEYLGHIFEDDGETRTSIIPAFAKMIKRDSAYENCRVIRLTHSKEDGGKNHEFIQVEVEHTPSHTRALFVTDRVPVSADALNQPTKVHKWVILSPFLRPSSSSPETRVIPARDKVVCGSKTQILKPYKDYHDVEIHSFEDGIPLVDFSILLLVIHQHALDYVIDNTQCYWFAASIMVAAKHLFGGTAVAVRDAVRGSVYQGIKVKIEESETDILQAYRVAKEKYEKDPHQAIMDDQLIARHEKELAKRDEERERERKEWEEERALFKQQQEDLARLAEERAERERKKWEALFKQQQEDLARLAEERALFERRFRELELQVGLGARQPTAESG